METWVLYFSATKCFPSTVINTSKKKVQRRQRTWKLYSLFLSLCRFNVPYNKSQFLRQKLYWILFYELPLVKTLMYKTFREISFSRLAQNKKKSFHKIFQIFPHFFPVNKISSFFFFPEDFLFRRELCLDDKSFHSKRSSKIIIFLIFIHARRHFKWFFHTFKRHLVQQQRVSFHNWDLFFVTIILIYYPVEAGCLTLIYDLYFFDILP